MDVREMLLTFVSMLSLVVSVIGEKCTDPEVKSQIYSTKEGTMSSLTTFVIEFELQCKNNVKGVNLYAEMNGVAYPVSRDTESSKYQISFVDEHRKFPAGSYQIKIFDEDGFAAYRKAERNEESTKDVKALVTVSHSHSGVWHGPWVHSETIVILITAIVCYSAVVSKAKLMS